VDRSQPVTRLTLEGSTGQLTDAGRRLTNHSPFAENIDGNPIPPITVQNVLYLTDEITPIEDVTETSTVVPYGNSPLDKVELHISNLKNVLLESVYNIEYAPNQYLGANAAVPVNATGLARPTQGTSLVPNVTVNLHKIFRELGYISGKFKFQLNFHRNLLGSRETPASISSISDDRTEINVSFRGPSYIENAILVDENGNRSEFYLNFKLNKLLRIAAFVIDLELSTNREKVYKVTLQAPLPSDIGLSTPCWIDQQMADPALDTIAILPPKKKDPIVGLRSPNFSIELEDGVGQSTAFQSWNSILGSNPTSSQQLINRVLSSSFGDVELNIDYRDYSNFVFYGSAAERLTNFKYKLGLVEYYDTILKDLSSLTPSPAVDNNISDITSKKSALIGGFDGYEKYLYYESSSYESSSLGEFTPTTWPKSNNLKPYVNYPSTSSEGIAWCQGQLDTASLYDKRNLESLVRTIPDFISSDSSNDSYTTFVHMVGQHFDILRSYVEQIPNIHSRKEPLYEGVAKDLVYHVLRSLGIEGVNGFSIQDLWLSSLGLNQSGSYTQSGSLHSIPTDDIVKETWKRILNNLPYLLKTKGTERGIRALINCYGVPATVYRVREYSGPYDYDSKTITKRDRYKKIEKFNYALFLSGSATVTCTAPAGASTLQYRFKPIYTPGITEISNNPTITSQPSGSSITHAIVTIGGTDFVLPYDSWIGITITGGSTYVTQNRDGQINIFSTVGGGSAGNVILGGNPARVQVQEVKYWDDTFSESLIKEYCLNPQSLLGVGTIDTYDTANWQFNNTAYDYKAAYEQLLARFPLGSTLQIFGTGSIQPDQSLATTPAAVVGVTTSSFVGNVENYYVWMPNLGDSMDLSNKIRIEDAKLDGQLNNFISVEKSRYDTYQLDSPKVGVFFSPQDELNEDIADQFGGMLLDDFIGDPRDEYEDKYRALDAVKNHYLQKFTDRNQLWKYLRLVENFDASMFYLIKKFLPARAAKMVGLVIQPNLLDRPKLFKRPLGIERMDWNSQIPMTYYEFEAQYVTYEGSTPPIGDLIDAEYIAMESNDTISTISLTGDVPMYTTVAVVYTFDNSIHDDMISAMDSSNINYLPLSTARSRYLGSQVSSPGFNIPSDDTPDGGPAVEYWTTSPVSTGNTGNVVAPLGPLLGPGSGPVLAGPNIGPTSQL
jgi:hypothetical protein